MSVDWDKFTALIADGIRKCLLELQAKFPQHDFFAYALTTHPMEMHPVSFHANSVSHRDLVLSSVEELDQVKVEKRISELIAAFNADPVKAEQIRKSKYDTLNRSRFFYTWHWSEWHSLKLESQITLQIESYEWLKHHFDLDLVGLGGVDEKTYYEALHQIQACMEEALRICDGENLFCHADDREKIILYVGGDNDGFEIPVSTMKFLNPVHALTRNFSQINLDDMIY